MLSFVLSSIQFSNPKLEVSSKELSNGRKRKYIQIYVCMCIRICHWTSVRNYCRNKCIHKRQGICKEYINIVFDHLCENICTTLLLLLLLLLLCGYKWYLTDKQIVLIFGLHSVVLVVQYHKWPTICNCNMSMFRPFAMWHVIRK